LLATFGFYFKANPFQGPLEVLGPENLAQNAFASLVANCSMGYFPLVDSGYDNE
jgi:hypothetical protein